MTGPHFRFMFRLTAPDEPGKIGRILARLFGKGLAFYVEPWPENDWAVYVKAEADNKALFVRLAKEAGLSPVSFAEVDGL